MSEAVRAYVREHGAQVFASMCALGVILVGLTAILVVGIVRDIIDSVRGSPGGW